MRFYFLVETYDYTTDTITKVLSYCNQRGLSSMFSITKKHAENAEAVSYCSDGDMVFKPLPDSHTDCV